jgi:hypothetical protein
MLTIEDGNPPFQVRGLRIDPTRQQDSLTSLGSRKRGGRFDGRAQESSRQRVAFLRYPETEAAEGEQDEREENPDPVISPTFLTYHFSIDAALRGGGASAAYSRSAFLFHGMAPGGPTD